jgi:predicted nucleotide-binding protein (sugar kinase/HSP70/actin superfamily)
VATEKPKPIRFEQPVPVLQNSSTFRTADFWQYHAQNAVTPNFIARENQVVPAMCSIL